MTYADGMSFAIDASARTVWIDWREPLTIDNVPSYLLGPIIGLVLRLRGITSLHASAVLVDGRAVVFTGPKGAGKSTVAAALGVHGVAVLADDTIALRRSGPMWMAAPGFPRLRLWPESAEALSAHAGDEGFLPPGTSGSSTRYHLDLQTRQRFEHDSVPLGLIYVIGRVSDSGRPDVSSLASADAVIALVGNTYANQLLDRDLRAREFDVLSQLVEQVPVRRLTRPSSLSTLSAYRDFVLDDLNACGLRSSAA
jgi:hypothetical protein